MSAVLTLSLAAFSAAPVLAGTPCAVWSGTPVTDGNYMWANSYIDCPTNPVSDWIKGELVESFGPFAFTRDDCINNANNSSQHSCQTYYYCNGHGTDDWFEKSKGRDADGGESVWIEGAHVSRTC